LNSKDGAAELFESGREGFRLKDPRDTILLADVLLTLQDPRIVGQTSRAASDLAPRRDMKKHMAEVMRWLGMPRLHAAMSPMGSGLPIIESSKIERGLRSF